MWGIGTLKHCYFECTYLGYKQFARLVRKCVGYKTYIAVTKRYGRSMTAENARGLDSVNMITEGILAHSAGNDVYMDAERPYARIAMAPGFVNTLGCAITAGIAVEVESVLMVNAASGVRIVRNSVQSPYHQYLYNKNNLSNIYQ